MHRYVTLSSRRHSRRNLLFIVVTYRRPILCDAPVRAALRDAVKTVPSRHPAIDAWVLLPDHMHCVWTLPPGDADYAMR
ncbi:MAG: transposase [Methylobacter sp.]|nr:transposase [Methylobacter sp.]